MRWKTGKKGAKKTDMKEFTVAIIGCGSRGAESYGRIMSEDKERFKIVALCDIDAGKLDKYSDLFGVGKESLFTDEKIFFEEKRADILVIATMDNDHVRQCERALELGYDILLEKPITKEKAECDRLLKAHKKYGGKVVVCHVLRYAPAFLKVKSVLDSGICGQLVMIDAIEQVCFWHQAHSFVRGNWRNSEESSPMILQKCCHDMDILQYYIGARCESVSSMGELRYFNRAHWPEGAAERCTECKFSKTCVYSAENIYVRNWKDIGSPAYCWPYTVLTNEYPLTEQALREAIRTGPYGRCVFCCDNDVVDHQIVAMTFENGVKANLRMTAFTPGGGRIMKLYCTEGMIELDEAQNKLEVKCFDKPVVTYALDTLVENGHNHGGGDNGLIDDFYKVLTTENSSATTLERSVESHLMAITAEKSRVNGGILCRVHD